MAEFRINMFSHTLGHSTEIEVTVPSLSAVDMDLGDETLLTHKVSDPYPVLYLLHGHAGDFLAWSRGTCVQRYAEERRMAVVTVSAGNVFYMNDAYNARYYDFLSEELPEFITSYFPISKRPEDTYIAGLSMGGYGALMHGLAHPEKYRAVGAFSPVTVMTEDLASRLRHDIPPLKDLRQLALDAKTGGQTLPELFIAIGGEDFLLESAEDFAAWLSRNKIDRHFDVIPGYQHEWAFWEKELPVFMDWLPRSDAYAGMEIHGL